MADTGSGTVRSRAQLEQIFRPQAKPTDAQFADLFKSHYHKEDNIPADALSRMYPKASEYFDDGQAGQFTAVAFRNGDVVSGLVCDFIGDPVTYTKVTTKPDGSAVTDADIVAGCGLYRKKGTEYFMLNYVGYLPVKRFGAVGDDVANDTVALRNAFACGATRFDLGNGTYKVSLTEGQSLACFTSAKHIYIIGSNALIRDYTVYTLQGVFTTMFLFDGCFDVSISVNYEGIALGSPATDLGYTGGIFARFINGCERAYVSGVLKHLRYGVQSGEYDDPTKGDCKNITVDLTTYFVGYPVATYLASDVKGKITAYDVHRAAYIAGCTNCNLNIRFKNQYIADVVALVTDAKTGTGTSQGSTNIDIDVTDLGSDIVQPGSFMTGISLSRVDPDTVFSDIRCRFNAVCSDTFATTLGGFTINSGVNLVLPAYTYNWEQTIYLRNIKASGVIDRSAQTVAGNVAGDIYINTLDSGTHYATVENLDLSDIVIIPSAGNTRDAYVMVPGLLDSVLFKNYVTLGLSLQLQTNAVAQAVFLSSQIKSFIKVGSGTTASFVNSSVLTPQAAEVVVSGDAKVGGANCGLITKTVELNLIGADVTWAGAIPEGALVLACTGVLTDDIGSATGYLVGVAGALSKFVNTNNVTTGDQFGRENSNPSFSTADGYFATTDIIVTAKTAPFTDGKLRLVLHYFKFEPPQ